MENKWTSFFNNRHNTPNASSQAAPTINLGKTRSPENSFTRVGKAGCGTKDEEKRNCRCELKIYRERMRKIIPSKCGWRGGQRGPKWGKMTKSRRRAGWRGTKANEWREAGVHVSAKGTKDRRARVPGKWSKNWKARKLEDTEVENAYERPGSRFYSNEKGWFTLTC